MQNKLPLGIAAACFLLTACNGNGPSQPSPGPTATGNAFDQVSPQDRKQIAGAGKVGDPASSIALPAFKDEKLLYDQQDTAAFAKAGMRAFPEIASVRFHPDDSMKDDPDATKMYRDSFYAGLYYAEMIKAGDGSSLFDLITKCGRLTDPASGAQVTAPMDTSHKGYWVGIQYFPAFKQVGSGEKTNLQILFDRDGNTLAARSSWFSSHVLTSKTFMADHGIRCM